MSVTKDTYNKIAKDWHKDHSSDDWWVEGTEKLLSCLRTNATILDVGCGAGTKSKYLNDRNFSVTGIDFAENMITLAKEHVPGVHFEVGDIFELDKVQGTFDCVFAQAVLLHIPKNRMIEAIGKLKDKLNPGGLLYIAVKEIKADGIEEKIVTENDYGYDYSRFFSYYRLEELRRNLEKSGFDIIWDMATLSGKTNWLQIIGKKLS